jgi:hypothetical protein
MSDPEKETTEADDCMDCDEVIEWPPLGDNHW